MIIMMIIMAPMMPLRNRIIRNIASDLKWRWIWEKDICSKGDEELDDDDDDDVDDDDDDENYLEIMERMEMVILARQEERGTLLSLEAPCNVHFYVIIISSDRSSCTDDGLLYVRAARQLFQIFTQSLDAIDV